MEIWSLAAAVNIQQALPLIQISEKISVKKMAKRIERKFETPAKWNCLVNERCEPGIKSVLMLP